MTERDQSVEFLKQVHKNAIKELKHYGQKKLELKKKNKFKRCYGKIENIRGIDIGYKYTNKKSTKTLAIRLHVEEIFSRTKLKKNKIETFDDYFGKTHGVYTDIIQNKFKLMDHNLEREKPRAKIQAGISVGRHLKTGKGTLGLIVKHTPHVKPGKPPKPSKPAILSNWHVLFGTGAKKGNKIIQPGHSPTTKIPDHHVATLEAGIRGEKGDAAIALVRDEVWKDPQRVPKLKILGLGKIAKKLDDPEIGDEVIKSGLGSRVTKGKVDGMGRYFFEPEVYGYPKSHGRVAIDGFIIVPVYSPTHIIAKKGDSGSAWLKEEENGNLSVVGLHFSGENRRNPKYAMACYAKSVFAELNISLFQKEDLTE
jgi:endonuclease G